MASALTAVVGQGNTASTQYVYDDSNRLTDVINKNPTTGANVHKSTFVYDAFSRLRVSQEFNWSGSSWVKQTELRRNYDGMNCNGWTFIYCLNKVTQFVLFRSRQVCPQRRATDVALRKHVQKNCNRCFGSWCVRLNGETMVRISCTFIARQKPKNPHPQNKLVMRTGSTLRDGV